MKMSARAAAGVTRRARRRDVKTAPAKPPGPVQEKAGCSLHAMVGGSGPETAPAGYACPLCSGRGGAAGRALEAPRDRLQHKGAGSTDAAEAQARARALGSGGGVEALYDGSPDIPPRGS